MYSGAVDSNMIRLSAVCKNLDGGCDNDVKLGSYLEKYINTGRFEYRQAGDSSREQTLFPWAFTFESLSDADCKSIADVMWDAYSHFMNMQTKNIPHQGFFCDISGENIKCTFSIGDDILDKTELETHMVELVRAMSQGAATLDQVAKIKGRVSRI